MCTTKWVNGMFLDIFQRAAWVPFFDNMDSIIFLAPISGFDETLAEDPNVNRLVRSLSSYFRDLKLDEIAGGFDSFMAGNCQESTT
jgi:hypothetical protein